MKMKKLIIFLFFISLYSCAHDYSLFIEGKKFYEKHEYDRAEQKFIEFKKKYPESQIIELADDYLKKIEEINKKELVQKNSIKHDDKIIIKDVEVKEKKEKLLTNVFYDTDVKEILRTISSETGINIITDDTVQGVISVKFENQPLEKVLKMVLSPGGYTFKKIDDYYIVGSADPRSPLFNYLSNTVEFKPKFLKAKEIVKLISPSFSSYIQVNEERNLLTVTASNELVARILEDIKKVDKMPKQITLEALVVELSNDGRKSLGIDWSATSRKFSASSDALELSITYISQPAITRVITAKIKALVETGLASIKATPRVTTMDGEEASINIGLEQYISLVTGPVTYPYVKLETIKAGVNLNILPLISDEDNILVKIKPAEVSDFIEVGKDGLPMINKRSVNTTVVVKNQETIVIGGLIRKREIEKVSRVPILGYIPILNFIFSKTEKITEDSEVLILITPRIVEMKT